MRVQPTEPSRIGRWLQLAATLVALGGIIASTAMLVAPGDGGIYEAPPPLRVLLLGTAAFLYLPVVLCPLSITRHKLWRAFFRRVPWSAWVTLALWWAFHVLIYPSLMPAVGQSHAQTFPSVSLAFFAIAFVYHWQFSPHVEALLAESTAGRQADQPEE
ncbi:hypothetical protein ABI59_11120 [Acidobacteria bacterium Mor1]|nr:hypothetical protein ABI59_11120 [Acidobacteria bacterium Mor1]